MTKPTHRITVEVMDSLTDPFGAWALPERVLITKGHPNIVSVEEIPRPIVAGDIVANKHSNLRSTYEVVAVRGIQAWITGIESSTNLLVYLNNLTRV